MSLFSLSTWSIFWAGWVKGIILGTWYFRLGLTNLRVRIWGLLGQGIGDLDSGLTNKV